MLDAIDDLRRKIAPDVGYLTEEEAAELELIQRRQDELREIDELSDDEQQEKCRLCRRAYFLEKKISVLNRIEMIKEESLRQLEERSDVCPMDLVMADALRIAMQALSGAVPEKERSSHIMAQMWTKGHEES